MFDLTINLVLSFLVFSASVLLVFGAKKRRLWIERENSIWDFFAEACSQSKKVDPRVVGIELQWVALARCGIDRDTTMRSLSIKYRVRVQTEIDALVLVGQRLVDLGLLRYFQWSPPDRIVKNVCLPSDTLLCVDAKGVVFVQQAMLRREACSEQQVRSAGT